MPIHNQSALRSETNLKRILISNRYYFEYICIQMNYKQKIKSTENILKNLKKVLSETLWESDPNLYSSDRILLPWIEEDAEYEIKKLKLTKDDEIIYLQKLHNLFGEYSDANPYLKRNKSSNKK